MVDTIVSPHFDLKGWNFLEWLKGNWSTIKELVKLGVPYIVSIQFFAENPAAQVMLTLVGKFLLDVGEYWVKEYKA